MIKNCDNCKYINYEWYQDHTCSCKDVLIDNNIDAEDFCTRGFPKCSTIHPDQTTDCKYFKLAFWMKVCIIKTKICMAIYTWKMNRYKRKKEKNQNSEAENGKN